MRLPPLRTVVLPSIVLAVGLSLVGGAPAGATPTVAGAVQPSAAATSTTTGAPAAVAVPSARSRPKPLVGLRPGRYKGRVVTGNGLRRARIAFRVTDRRSLSRVRSTFWTNCDYGFGYRGKERRTARLKRVKVGREGRFEGRRTPVDQRVSLRGRLKGRDLTWGWLKFSDTFCSRSSAITVRRVGR